MKPYNKSIMRQPILSIQNISLVKNNHPILNHITATIDPKEIVVISGPSGSGKSSFLRLLNRLEDPSEGTIDFHNQPIEAYSPVELRRQIALVSQTPIMFPGSVLQNFQLVEQINHRPHQSAVFYEEKLQWVGLPASCLNQEAQSLSLGEKQRFSLARALLNNPEILLLDEPTSALDPEASTHLLNAIEALNRDHGLTIVMVTHQKAHGAHIGQQFWNLKAGQLTTHIAVPSAEGGAS